MTFDDDVAHDEKCEEMDIGENGAVHDGNVEKTKTAETKEKHIDNGEMNIAEQVDTEDEEEQNENVEKMTEVEEEIKEITNREHLTSYFKQRDNTMNQVYQSEIPQVCKDEPCQLGVDEAGRGPVLGPMVYGISYAPLSQKQLLVDMGCADSKSLTEAKRDIIFDKICQNKNKMGWAVDAISPCYISSSMYKRTKTSLNEVSMNSAINLIKKTIEAGVFVSEIYVDTVGPAEKYQAKLEGIFPGIKIKVAKKADSTYPIVSAASICAKVSRDHALRAWQFEDVNETEYGSGYPNDPVTKKWLTNNVDPIFGFPNLVRFSWSTAEKVLESQAALVEWEDPEEDSFPSSGLKISSFFAATPKTNTKDKKKKHAFFTQRCLSSAVTI